MVFDDSQMRQLTVGAVFIDQADGCYSFRRFTEDQKAAFGAVFPMWAVRSDYTSGICIDFHTDANAVSVEVGSQGRYEVLVDDLCTYFETLNNGDQFRVCLDGSDHRVTIILPNLEVGKIKRISLDGETYVKPHTYSTKVAFYGDSITQGSTAVKSSQSYTWLLTRHFDFHSVNFGVGGIRFQPETLDYMGYDPEIVIVSLGTNNYGSNRPLDLLQTNCPAYFERIRQIYPNSKLFCITPIWRADGDVIKNAGTVHSVRAYIAQQALKYGFTVIDGFTLVPHRTEYYEDERLHPNDLGFALYTLNLIKALKPYL